MISKVTCVAEEIAVARVNFFLKKYLLAKSRQIRRLYLIILTVDSALLIVQFYGRLIFAPKRDTNMADADKKL